jgi:hypothetical protein
MWQWFSFMRTKGSTRASLVFKYAFSSEVSIIWARSLVSA